MYYNCLFESNGSVVFAMYTQMVGCDLDDNPQYTTINPFLNAEVLYNHQKNSIVPEFLIVYEVEEDKKRYEEGLLREKL